jgi:hypothetical protein
MKAVLRSSPKPRDNAERPAKAGHYIDRPAEAGHYVLEQSDRSPLSVDVDVHERRRLARPRHALHLAAQRDDNLGAPRSAPAHAPAG